MTKDIFLTRLEQLLQSTNPQECSKILSYYSEMIDDFTEEGLSEEEAIQKIGTPGTIAEQFITEETKEKEAFSRGKKFLIMILLLLGSPLWVSLLAAGFSLLLAALILIFSAYLVIWCIPLITGSFSIASFILSIISLLGSFFVMTDNLALGVLQLGLGILSIGVFLLLGILTLYFSKYFFKLSKQFSTWIYQVVFPKLRRRAL